MNRGERKEGNEQTMRKYAYLKEPLERGGSGPVVKVMLCETGEGWYLFEYGSPDAVMSSSDILYDTAEDLYDEWNGLIDERGWIRIEDPLPGCQQDAFIPLRVRGRDTGMPEWGKFETLKDGRWVGYGP